MSKPRGKATQEQLWMLHGLLVKELVSQLREGRPSAATMAVIRKVLADNSIVVTPAMIARTGGSTQAAMAEMLAKLPTFPEEGH